MIETFPELMATIEMSLRNTHVVSFTVYTVVGFSGDVPSWEIAGDDRCGWTEDFANAEWLIRGDLKWDGCVNYNMNQDECMLHECDPSAFENQAKIWRKVYIMAQQLMPNYNWNSLVPEVKE